jgi:nucleoid DNA-binding protein
MGIRGFSMEGWAAEMLRFNNIKALRRRKFFTFKNFSCDFGYKAYVVGNPWKYGQMQTRNNFGVFFFKPYSIARILSKVFGYTIATIKPLIIATIEELFKQLVEDGYVSIPGFGSFLVVVRPPYRYKTLNHQDEWFEAKAHCAVYFKASRRLKQALNARWLPLFDKIVPGLLAKPDELQAILSAEEFPEAFPADEITEFEFFAESAQ